MLVLLALTISCFQYVKDTKQKANHNDGCTFRNTSSVVSTESTEEVSSEEEVEDLVGGESSEEVTSEETASTGDSGGTTTNTSSKKPTSSRVDTGIPVVSENPELQKAKQPTYDIKPLTSGKNKGKKSKNRDVKIKRNYVDQEETED